MSDFDLLRFVSTALSWIVSAGAWLYAHKVRREQATRDEIATVRAAADDRLNAHSERIGRIETTVRTLPTQASLHELALSVKELAGDVRVVTKHLDGMDGVVERIDRIVQRQEDYLREHR